MLGFLFFLGYLVVLLPVIIPLIQAMIKSFRFEKIEWQKWNWKRLIGFSFFGVVALTLFLALMHLWTEVLWFEELGYAARLWKAISTRWYLLLAFGIGSVLFVKLNVWITRKLVPGIPKDYEPKKDYWGHKEDWRVHSQIVRIVTGIVLLAIGLMMGFWARGDWLKILMFVHQVPAQVAEPIFQKDASFYLFSLPFYKFLSGWLLTLFSLTIAVLLALYSFYGFRADEVIGGGEGHKIAQRGIIHGSIVFLGIFGILIWRTVLSMYNLLYSSWGVVFGPGYTDIYARLPAYRIYIFILAIVAIFLLISAFRRHWKMSLGILIGWVGVALILLAIYPGIVQRYGVRPNELERETPYITNNIALTRKAFGLDKIEAKDFEAEDRLTPKMIEENRATIDNIRLWDWRALWDTYKQIQEIRLYYEFGDVDIDRYVINEKYRQVMLSARELPVEQLPERSKTWINQRFKYTHGYGLCLNAVNEFTPEGLPRLLIKDMPPISKISEIEISRPQIYFGEMTQGHIFVKTTTEEFDHPKGDENVYTLYQGTAGIPFRSRLRKLALALRFDGIRMLLSSHLTYRTPESKIVFRRQIEERVKALAPFLVYDEDPYLVIDSLGKLWFILDAYTISQSYPYSEPFPDYPEEKKKINYIRNSLKLVIDCYNGSVDFYIFDESDPIVLTLKNIFPDFFKSKTEMPEGLKKHIRYPEDFLRIQAKMYAIYHMENPQVFYNKEDLWEIAREIYIGTEQEVLPYYVIIKLPGEKKEEFLQMVPFTPTKKNNMIGWMAGRCDDQNYGKLLALKFPKGKLIFGPLQIEARIDQEPEMSEKITLWGQRGSEVIRGNLLMIPIENSLLAVEPFYLQAEKAKIPQIRKVITAIGERLVWEDSLGESLNRLLAAEVVIAPERIEVRERKEIDTEALIKEATRYLEALQKILEELGKPK